MSRMPYMTPKRFPNRGRDQQESTISNQKAQTQNENMQRIHSHQNEKTRNHIDENKSHTTIHMTHSLDL